VPQLYRTFRAIWTNPGVGLAWGLTKHASWHLRRLIGAFPFEQRISESRIIARDGRCGVSALINNQGMYDWNNMHLLKYLLNDGGTFFDVGANIGSYTLVAAEQREAYVHAFEPHPTTYEFLCDNVRLNHMRNVTTHCLAASDEDGALNLTNEAGSSTNRVQRRSSETIQVPCIKLSSFCSQHGLKPDYLKIDVEGFEYEVLAGLGTDLVFVKVAIIEISSRAGAVCALLNQHGLQGPYTYDVDSNAFRHHDAKAREDPIFVSSLARSGLAARGFSVPPA